MLTVLEKRPDRRQHTRECDAGEAKAEMRDLPSEPSSAIFFSPLVKPAAAVLFALTSAMSSLFAVSTPMLIGKAVAASPF